MNGLQWTFLRPKCKNPKYKHKKTQASATCFNSHAPYRFSYFSKNIRLIQQHTTWIVLTHENLKNTLNGTLIRWLLGLIWSNIFIPEPSVRSAVPGMAFHCGQKSVVKTLFNFRWEIKKVQAEVRTAKKIRWKLKIGWYKKILSSGNGSTCYW